MENSRNNQLTSKTRIGVYPGSFDPITNGHLDIIKRASKLFDEVIVLVAYNSNKSNNRFSVKERVEMINGAIKDLNNVRCDSYSGLTIDFAKKNNAKFLIRGLRVVSDFDYEWSLAASNEFIDHDIEMVFLMSKKENTFISSSNIVELSSLGVDVSSLVPKGVNEYLLKHNKKSD